jgi:hypothetical protein
MPRKHSGRQKGTLGKVASNARKYRTETIVPQSSRRGKSVRVTPPVDSKHIKLPSGQTVFRPDLRGSSAERSLGALRYMRQHDLSFSQSAKVWRLDPRTFRKYAKSGLRSLKDGHIKALAKDRIRYVFDKPGAVKKSGRYILEFKLIETRSLDERRTYVQWSVALEQAAKGNWEPMDEFPKGTVIDGTLLPTNRFQVQAILEALEHAGAKFEGPYRVRAMGAA